MEQLVEKRLHQNGVGELIAAWQDAILALDADRTVANYAAEAIYEDPAAANDERYPEVRTGHDAIRSLYEGIFSLPRVSFAFVSSFVAADGRAAAVEWVWCGDRLDCGDEYEIRGLSLLRLGDGRITHETIYYDTSYAPYQVTAR